MTFCVKILECQMVLRTVADGLLSTPEAFTASTAKYQVPDARLLITYVSIPTVLMLILFVIVVALVP
jgi:hypothetical protein